MRYGPGRWRSGLGLIELLIVIAIIVIIAGVYYGGVGKKGGGREKSLPAEAIDRTIDVTCQSNLRQLRMNIQAETAVGEPPPRSLKAAAKGLGPQFMQCPSSFEAYVYNPKDGTVCCTTEGHEEY
ncbi:MAG: prepilin-type N-terminal cleavage/methylation domain-containing protein [Armatimonadota bacterium]|jgi:prepilin-type N-terminal cleavage/methylation domain-containing protein